MKTEQKIAIAVLFLVVASVTSKDYFGGTSRNVRVLSPENQVTSVAKVEREESSVFGKSADSAGIPRASHGLRPSNSTRLIDVSRQYSNRENCEDCQTVATHPRSLHEAVYCSGYEMIVSPEHIQAIESGFADRQVEKLQALTPIDSVFQDRPIFSNVEKWLEMPYFIRVNLLPVIVAEDDGSNPSEAFIHPQYLRAYLRQLFLDVEVLPSIQLNSSVSRVPDENDDVGWFTRERIGDLAYDKLTADIAYNKQTYGNVIVVYFIAGTKQKGEHLNTGYGWGGGDTIVVRSGLDSYAYSSTLLAHELGHCFGLDHTNSPSGLVPEEAAEFNVMQPVGVPNHWRFEHKRFDGFQLSQLEWSWYTITNYRRFVCDPSMDHPHLSVSGDQGGYRDITFIFPSIEDQDTEVQTSLDLRTWETKHVCPSEWGAPIVLRWTETEKGNYFRLRR